MEPIRPERVTESIRPFLGRPSANPDDFFRGEAAFPGTLAPEDRNYYYHATTLGNLPGILEQGLDPDMGGRGGAGEYIAAPVDQEAGDEFAERDAGFVYLADNAEIAARYAFQYDDQADGFVESQAINRGNKEKSAIDRDNIERSAVILRVRKDVLQKEEDSMKDSLERDDAEVEGAYRTTQRLFPSNLEVLTEEGWVPLRDRNLRQEIYHNVQNTLGRMAHNLLPEDENDIREREARPAGAARPHRDEISLEELRSEEGPRREVGRTPSINHTEKSFDKSSNL
ncbi:MAG: hypothetical protein K2J95_02050 [Lachnospiraceae bacterium]|nr:hypothetical protein [Lachnospiraceae bacterium]